ncbi:MAG: HDOD domain-containing protein [Desulfobacterales bacterium]|nr:HDOD domain-containing protein [Desulfobacterales bacterium]
MTDSLVGEKTIALSLAQEILTTSVEIPAIPENMRQIFQMVRQPEDNIDIPEFANLVESDPGLFTRILQLANSSYYSEVEKITTLRAAITRIGLREAVNTVCLGFFQKMLPKFPDIEGFSYNDFWAFSWACAVAARRLGHPALGMDVKPGDLYMAGMLQGLGKLLFAIHYPRKFADCVAKARKFESPLYEIEKDVFGTTDSLVAARVLRTWNLPANICEGVGFCHMPQHAEPDYILVAGLVEFAYAIAGNCGIGANGDGNLIELPNTFLGQKPKLSIAKPETQEALTDELTRSLQKKAGSMFPKSGASKPGTRTSSARTKKQAPSRQAPKKKSGVMGWVKSLFR